MKVTKDMSIALSLGSVYFFAAVLAAADVFAPQWIGWYVQWRMMKAETVGRMLATMYSASIFGWVCLWALYRLLRNIRDEIVFDAGNVRLLRTISWCCAFAAVIFLVSGVYYLPFLLVAVAAAFMMLIVCVVKNVFQQAIEMKSELDLTI